MDLTREIQRPGSRFLAVLETCALVMAFYFGIKVLVLTPFPFRQYDLVGWDFNAHFVMIAMPLALIYLRRERPSDYGIGRAGLSDPDIRRQTLFIVVVLPLAWIVFGALAVNFLGAKVTLNLPPGWGHKTWLSAGPWKTAVGVGLTVVFEIVSCGLAEEIMFRGYIQGRLNNVFGRPYSFMGANFGWGLIIASLLFGFGHGLGFFNPFGEKFGVSDAFDFLYVETLATAGSGLVFGWVRDRTGGIAVPAILHATVGLVFGVVQLSN